MGVYVNCSCEICGRTCSSPINTHPRCPNHPLPKPGDEMSCARCLTRWLYDEADGDGKLCPSCKDEKDLPVVVQALTRLQRFFRWVLRRLGLRVGRFDETKRLPPGLNRPECWSCEGAPEHALCTLCKTTLEERRRLLEPPRGLSIEVHSGPSAFELAGVKPQFVQPATTWPESLRVSRSELMEKIGLLRPMIEMQRLRLDYRVDPASMNLLDITIEHADEISIADQNAIIEEIRLALGVDKWVPMVFRSRAPVTPTPIPGPGRSYSG
jgi:hypothetical protein